ncbi:MAG TPA: amino acid permease, partial [Acidimicrobiales bacterium]|nr:amino acid permease [Acidimicrobiales bacterium]
NSESEPTAETGSPPASPPGVTSKGNASASGVELPENLGYKLKNLLLGKPLTSESFAHQRLSKTVAAGVLSPDCISSTAYGTEEMLTILVPAVGVAAFSLVIPVTFAILGILMLVTLSYREVVQVYTKAGGAYVVSRDNFGPNVAQVAAVALIIDYTLTVAVQIAAGAAALTSAIPILVPYTVYICVGVLAVMCYGNLRGIREAGSAFAFPTYFFIVSLGFVVVVGLVRGFLGQLHPHSVHLHGAISIGHSGSGFLLGASVFVMLRALANGGSSLTGLEAVSNGISVFRTPVVRNARMVLAFIAISLGSLVFGVSMIAHWTHAVPFELGSPTVVAQEVRYVLGNATFGNIVFYLVQFSTMLILFTGGNTSFNGFPYLASFVAEDSFLPRWLTRRGHRLVFSSGIIVLTAIALILILVTRARLNSLVALYAIGVFIGFTMAGAGMVRYHHRNKESGWKWRVLINGSASALSALVVVVFAVTKFTEGAWVVVVALPVLVYALIRLHRQYVIEAEELEEGAPRVTEVPVMRRHAVVVMVDLMDLATLRALRYGRTLTPDEVHAVHFVIDEDRAASLAHSWQRLSLSRIPLEMVECPDRRLVRAALEYCTNLALDGETQVSVLLPRRFYEKTWSRILHDRTADSIAEGISKVPHVNATIIPFHLGGKAPTLDSPMRMAPTAELPEVRGAHSGGVELGSRIAGSKPGEIPQSALPAQLSSAERLAGIPEAEGTQPIGEVRYRQMVAVAGRVKSVRIQPYAGVPNLECLLVDGTGALPLVFVGRREVAGIGPGAKLVARGRVCEHHGRLSILNPEYEFLAATPT